jgi:hypothetical protein
VHPRLIHDVEYQNAATAPKVYHAGCWSFQVMGVFFRMVLSIWITSLKAQEQIGASIPRLIVDCAASFSQSVQQPCGYMLEDWTARTLESAHFLDDLEKSKMRQSQL